MLSLKAYYSPETDRKSFALVKSGKRVYGADNRAGWHEHPFGREEKHEPCAEKTLREFTKRSLEISAFGG